MNVIQQPKVLSRYDSMKKALENYTLEGTPDDKSSILQQVWFTTRVPTRTYVPLIMLEPLSM